MTVDEFRKELSEKLPIPVYHVLATPDEESKVLCWQELGRTHQFGDDQPVCNIISVQLDYFTTAEYDINPTIIELCLAELNVNYLLESQTYDNEREEWRYIWTARFLG